MIKVYAPRPVRVSTGFARNYSSDDLTVDSASHGSIANDNNNNNNTVEGTSFVPWNMYEVGDDLFNDFMDGCDLSANYLLPDPDDALLEKVYDEYLELLSEDSYLQTCLPS
nr:transcription factor MYB3-like [Ipomoea trifida]